MRIYNDTEYGLSMAVITESYRAMRFFREECEYGMGYVNLPCIGAEVHLPFGGVKKSGNGHPSAAGLVEAVTHKMAWTVNHGTEIKMAQGLTTRSRERDVTDHRSPAMTRAGRTDPMVGMIPRWHASADFPILPECTPDASDWNDFLVTRFPTSFGVADSRATRVSLRSRHPPDVVISISRPHSIPCHDGVPLSSHKEVVPCGSSTQERVPDIRTALPGPNARELLDRDTAYVSPSYTRVYPLVVDAAAGPSSRTWTATCSSTSPPASPSPPPATATRRSSRRSRTRPASCCTCRGTDFYYRPQIDLAERLAKPSRRGRSPKKVFFTNSGAEALEAALKLARWHTDRSRVVAFFGGVPRPHLRGDVAVRLEAGPPPRLLAAGAGHPPRHRSRGTAPSAACGAGVRLRRGDRGDALPPDRPAGRGGGHLRRADPGRGRLPPAPAGFLPALRELCDRHGILLVADEVQTGMGRTGKMFAVEHWGVEPDIICLAKGIASGMPLGAIIAKANVMDWPPGSHASTFGGNPVAAGPPWRRIDLLEREYMANADARGEQLRDGLRNWPTRHAGLADVRGLGLMTAVDIVTETGDSIRDPRSR